MGHRSAPNPNQTKAKPMHREPIISMTILTVGFDPAERLLEVEYKNGAIVQYGGVPADEKEDRMSLDSFRASLRRTSPTARSPTVRAATR